MPWPLAARRNFCSGLAVELQHDRLGLVDEAHPCRPLEIGAVRVLEVSAALRHAGAAPEALVGDIGVELLRVRRADAVLVAGLAAPAREHAEAGLALMVHQVVGIAAGIARRAVFFDQARQLEADAELDHHVLERADVAVGLDDRLADRIGGAVGDRRSAGRAARCSPSARDRSCRAGRDRQRTPSRSHRRRSR